MKNQYYKKDKKALIYKAISVSEPGKMPETYYTPTTPATVWCYSRQLSQNTIFEAKAHGEAETRFFVFNQRITVDLYDLILYRDKWYQVTRVDTEDDYISDVFVYVKDAPVGSNPKESDIKPYRWKPEDEN